MITRAIFGNPIVIQHQSHPQPEFTTAADVHHAYKIGGNDRILAKYTKTYQLSCSHYDGMIEAQAIVQQLNAEIASLQDEKAQHIRMLNNAAKTAENIAELHAENAALKVTIQKLEDAISMLTANLANEKANNYALNDRVTRNEALMEEHNKFILEVSKRMNM